MSAPVTEIWSDSKKGICWYFAAELVAVIEAVAALGWLEAAETGCGAAPNSVPWLAPTCVELPARGSAKREAPKTDAINIATSRPIATVPPVRFPACRMVPPDTSCYLTFASP